MSNGKILIAGAYGLAGRALYSAFRSHGLNVIAAGRSESKLQSLVQELGGEFRLLDAGAPDPEVLNSVDLLVNCVGPYLKLGQRMAEYAIQAGCHYIDIASEQEHFRRLQSLDAKARSAGVLLLTGAGAYPGISGLMLKQLMEKHPTGDSAELFLAMGPNPPGEGIAQILTGALEMVFPLEEKYQGHLRSIVPGGLIARSLPRPFGDVELLRWPQMEILDLAGRSRIASIKTGLIHGSVEPISPLQVWLVKMIRPDRWNWSYQLVTRMARKMSVEGSSDAAVEGCIVFGRVHDGDGWHECTLRARNTEEATAALPTLLSKKIMAGGLADRGTRSPLDLISLDEWVALVETIGSVEWE